MLQQRERKDTPKRVRFPGIVEDARALGLNRTTLWRYLTGAWPWPRYTKLRYDQLKKSQRRKKNGSA